MSSSRPSTDQPSAPALPGRRSLPISGALAAIGYRGFGIAALGVCLRAFGAVVSASVIVMAYFIGTLGSPRTAEAGQR